APRARDDEEDPEVENEGEAREHGEEREEGRARLEPESTAEEDERGAHSQADEPVHDEDGPAAHGRRRVARRAGEQRGPHAGPREGEPEPAERSESGAASEAVLGGDDELHAEEERRADREHAHEGVRLRGEALRDREGDEDAAPRRAA